MRLFSKVGVRRTPDIKVQLDKYYIFMEINIMFQCVFPDGFMLNRTDVLYCWASYTHMLYTYSYDGINLQNKSYNIVGTVSCKCITKLVK